MDRFLVLLLEAPLIAFGGELIDNYGVVRPFPAKSMIAGLIANALGVERHEGRRLQSLQDSIVMGSRVAGRLRVARDFQTAQLAKNDQGWTTRGKVEGRASSSASYLGPHLRYRDFWCDTDAAVVLRTSDAGPFGIDEVESALLSPARPLFVGRKACIPSSMILNGEVRAESAFHALMALSDFQDRKAARLQWPACDGPDTSDPLFDLADFRTEPICDERNWVSGVHAGQRLVNVMEIAPKDREPL